MFLWKRCKTFVIGTRIPRKVNDFVWIILQSSSYCALEAQWQFESCELAKPAGFKILWACKFDACACQLMIVGENYAVSSNVWQKYFPKYAKYLLVVNHMHWQRFFLAYSKVLILLEIPTYDFATIFGNHDGGIGISNLSPAMLQFAILKENQDHEK